MSMNYRIVSVEFDNLHRILFGKYIFHSQVGVLLAYNVEACFMSAGGDQNDCY